MNILGLISQLIGIKTLRLTLYIVRSEIFNLDYEIDTLHFISNGEDHCPLLKATRNSCNNFFFFYIYIYIYIHNL